MSAGTQDVYARYGLIGVESSWVDAVGYDRSKRALYVRFRSGVVCRYLGVEPSVYEEMMDAPSKGKFVHARIKGWNYTIVS